MFFSLAGLAVFVSLLLDLFLISTFYVFFVESTITLLFTLNILLGEVYMVSFNLSLG